jgi:hypothetical protein
MQQQAIRKHPKNQRAPSAHSAARSATHTRPLNTKSYQMRHQTIYTPHKFVSRQLPAQTTTTTHFKKNDLNVSLLKNPLTSTPRNKKRTFI